VIYSKKPNQLSLVFEKQRGIHLPMVLALLIAVVLASSAIFTSVRSFQDKVHGDVEMLRASLYAQSAIGSAELELRQQIEPPLVVSAVSAIPTIVGKMSVWSPLITDHKAITQVHPLTKEPMQWHQQGQQWWTTYGKSAAQTTDQQYAIEYETRVNIGEDIGQSKDYKGGSARLLFRITGVGKDTRNTTVVKQTVYSNVYY